VLLFYTAAGWRARRRESADWKELGLVAKEREGDPMTRFQGVIARNFVEQKVDAIMTSDIYTVEEPVDMQFVVDILQKVNCGAVVVNNFQDQIVGIISERDVLLKEIHWGKSTAKDVMTSRVEVIRRTGSIARALHMMCIGGFRHLPVVEKEQFATGILSVKDVAKRIYSLLLQNNAGEECDHVVGERQPIQKYFCSPLSIFSLKPPSCAPLNATVETVIQQLKKTRTGAVVVVDEDHVPRGLFTDRDFILKFAGKELDLSTMPITSAMTDKLVTAESESTIHEAYGTLSDGGFRHLPIVQDGRLVSLISLKDFLDELISDILLELENAQKSKKSKKDRT
jgi:CBS domain-containing protein